MSIFDTKKIKGAELFIKCLEEEGVEIVFGLPRAVSYTHLTQPTNREV